MKRICPNCYHKEPEEKLFCSKCGTRLVKPGGLQTSPVSPNAETGNMAPNSSLAATESMPAADARISIHIVSAGQILPLVVRAATSSRLNGLRGKQVSDTVTKLTDCVRNA